MSRRDQPNGKDAMRAKLAAMNGKQSTPPQRDRDRSSASKESSAGPWQRIYDPDAQKTFTFRFINTPEEERSRPRPVSNDEIPKWNPKDWEPGSITRSVSVDRNGTQTVREEIRQGNLSEMSRLADKHFQDAQDRREHNRDIHNASETRAYNDARHAREVNAQVTREVNQINYKDRAHERTTKHAEAMERMRYAAEDVRDAKQLERDRLKYTAEDARDAKQLERDRLRYTAEAQDRDNRSKEQRQMMTEEHDLERLRMELESQREINKQARKEAVKKERARIEELIMQEQMETERIRQEAIAQQQKAQLEYQRLKKENELSRQRLKEESRERERQARLEWERIQSAREERERAERAAAAERLRREEFQYRQSQMEYADRFNDRQAKYATQMGSMRMDMNDRQNERKHKERMKYMDDIETMINARETALNGDQQRRFAEQDHHDARVGRHERFVKLEREQRGLNREARLRWIFELMQMGDPDDIDLHERHVSPHNSLLEYKKNRNYIYSILVTGVKGIDRRDSNEPRVRFNDGTILELPKWGSGYLVHEELIETGVWLLHVYRAPHDMLWKGDYHEKKPHKYPCNPQ